MPEPKQVQDKQHDLRKDKKRTTREDAPDTEEGMLILFAPGKQEGARVTVRNVGQGMSAAEPIRKGAKARMVFVQTEMTVPVGTVVTLAMPGAYDVAEQQSFEGAVSFVCPTADQFGYSSGLGIRVVEEPQVK